MLRRFNFALILSALLLICSNYAYSQVRTSTTSGATDVNCVSGCSGGTTATENGTVSGGSSTGTGISFLYLWDGSNWKRATGTTSGLNVICTSGCGSPPATADNTAFVAGTTNVSPTAFVFNNSITSITSGSYGAARILANRIQLHAIWDAAGNERGANVNASNQLSVSIDNTPVVGLSAGVNTIGALTANQSVNNTQVSGTAIAVNNGTVSAGVQRVTIASDSTGQVTLASGANTIGAISNTAFIANAGTNLNTSALALDASISTLNTSVNSLLKPANTLTALTTLGTITNALPSGTNVIGHIISDTGSTTAVTQATGTNLHMVCDSGCTPGGSFADNSAFTLGSTAVNNTGYLFNDSLITFPTSGSAGVGRMSPLRVPYTDLSKDSSGLVAIESVALTQDTIDRHNGKLPAPSDKPGYYVRSGLAGNVVSQQNPLPVILPDAPDPCNKRKGNVAISQTSSTKYITGRPGYLIALCYIRIVVATAEILALVEGSGVTCGTGTAALSGSITVGNSESYASNGGFSAGVGIGTVATTNVSGNDFCINQNAGNRLAGNITYVYYLP